jgi:hypothetical protein
LIFIIYRLKTVIKKQPKLVRHYTYTTWDVQ